MPPELLMEGKLTKAADVFAFGVLLWSMLMGRLPWQGLQRTQVMLRHLQPHPHLYLVACSSSELLDIASFVQADSMV